MSSERSSALVVIARITARRPPGVGRQRCASPIRRASSASSGTIRVAIVAVSAERNERRRSERSSSSPSSAALASAQTATITISTSPWSAP